MNIAALDGGMAFNMIPARAALTFSMRPAPGVELGTILEQARGAIRSATAPLTMDWEDIATNPAFETRDLSSFVPLFGDRAKSPVTLPFGTEAGQFIDQGIDAVVLGPGRVEQAHKADEYVDLDELEDAESPSLQQVVERADMSSCVQIYIEGLSDGYRSAILMHDLEGLTSAEIASALGLTVATVKMRLHRARLRLRAQMEADCALTHDERNVLVCEPAP